MGASTQSGPMNMGVLIADRKFEKGQFVVTPGILDLMGKGMNVFAYLARHMNGDWGDLDEADKKENDFSVENGFRILSAYDTPQGKIWIITEADRSATTALLPEEY